VLDYLVVGRDNFVWATLLGIAISNKTWNRLNQEQKNAMMETGLEIEKRFNDESLKQDGKAAELFAQKGVKIHYLTDSEFKAWEEIAKQSAWKNFVRDVKAGKKLIDAALSVR
jgi:TRAP-type C4-dicarboxylate transport system substrate-binding protein